MARVQDRKGAILSSGSGSSLIISQEAWRLWSIIVIAYMNTRLVSWSRYVFLAGIALALVLVVPIAWFPFQLSKVAVFSACLLISAVMFVAGGGVRQLPRAHGVFMALSVGLLPLVYLLSTAFSPDRALSMAGFSIETDTVVFVAMAFVSFLMSFALFRTLRTARQLSVVVFWALGAAAIFQTISVLSGLWAIPFETFSDRSVNLIGKWNDLGLISSLLVLLVIARIELGNASNLWRIAGIVGGLFLVVLLGLVNFPLAWILLLAGSVIIAALSFLRQRADRSSGESAPTGFPGIMPPFAIAGIAFSLVFLLYGSAINVGLTSLFPVSSLEVRPGIESTLDVVSAGREGSARAMFIGTGPNTFGQSWLAHKPLEVNRTPFWSLDFNVGYSTLATAFGTVGLLGVLAWLIPLLLLVTAIIRVARLNVLSREERFIASVLSVASLFVLACAILYVPSQNIVLLGFILAGATFGFLWRQGRAGDEEASTSVVEGLGVLVLAAVLIVVVVSSSMITMRRFVAQAYTGAGLYSLSQGKIDEALASAQSAQRIERTADNLRLQTDAGAQKIAAIAQDTSLTPEVARQQFTELVQATIPAGQAAIAMNPTDYRSYVSLARIYDLLATLKIEGAYASAQEAYKGAAGRNPTNPAITLAHARLEAAAGDAAKTEEYLTKTLTLKPDYTDAILFVVQINVANNDLASAIRNTQIAVQTAPGVPSIWFQLGLLYYAGGDAKSAIPAFEQALTLATDYANAKYFLGLSYYQDGRQNDALRLFQELQASNPDNTEVRTIVANLEAGKQPLDGLVSQDPTSRQTAPVQQ